MSELYSSESTQIVRLLPRHHNYLMQIVAMMEIYWWLKSSRDPINSISKWGPLRSAGPQQAETNISLQVGHMLEFANSVKFGGLSLTNNGTWAGLQGPFTPWGSIFIRWEMLRHSKRVSHLTWGEFLNRYLSLWLCASVWIDSNYNIPLL